MIAEAVVIGRTGIRWSPCGAFEEHLGCRGVKRGRARKIDHPDEEHECRDRGDEHPMAPDEMQILVHVKRALRWLCANPARNPKPDVHCFEWLSDEKLRRICELRDRHRRKGRSRPPRRSLS